MYASVLPLKYHFKVTVISVEIMKKVALRGTYGTSQDCH